MKYVKCNVFINDNFSKYYFLIIRVLFCFIVISHIIFITT